MANTLSPSIFVFGDLHFPFQHRRDLKRALDALGDLKPSVVLQVGDLYDFYCFGAYPRSLDVLTPKAELSKGRERARTFWADVHGAVPKAVKVQIRGNHDARLDKRITEALPELRSLNTSADLWKFPHVITHMDPALEIPVFDPQHPDRDILVMHGHRSKLGDHARYNQQSTITGHSHTGGVVYQRNRTGIFWELNAGWLGDETKPVFNYVSQKTVRTWTRGFGFIDSRGPRFVSL